MAEVKARVATQAIALSEARSARASCTKRGNLEERGGDAGNYYTERTTDLEKNRGRCTEREKTWTPGKS